MDVRIELVELGLAANGEIDGECLVVGADDHISVVDLTVRKLKQLVASEIRYLQTC